METRDSGTLGVAGILCLFLEMCQGSMGTADVKSYSGHKSDPSRLSKLYQRSSQSDIFTIVEEADGEGTSRWGLLKSYQDRRSGWVSLDYVKRV